MAPSGDEPSTASLNVTLRLKAHQRQTQVGRAYGENIGYTVDLPRRKSFSPDASYYLGPRTGMRFLNGAPVFAVEVRSENDYRTGADREMERKRGEYFLAGTLVVWDVDLQSPDLIRRLTAEGGAGNPVTIYRSGDIADAEPAVAGWSMSVDDLFDAD